MSDIIEKNVQAAKDLDNSIRKQMLGGFEINNENFVEIDVSYPEIIPEDGNMPSKEQVAATHSNWVDNMAKVQLTNSLFLGLGQETSENHALSLVALKKIVELQPSSIEVKLNAHTEIGVDFHEFKVKHVASEFTFLESDLHLGYLRAVHFLAVRHDPDLTESINRRLSNVAGLSDEAWLTEAKSSKA